MAESKLQKIKNNWYLPTWWRDSVAPFITTRLMKFYFRTFPPDGINVINKDWDNLIILDGCRYDIFKNHNTIGGNLQKEVSHGSSTKEFLRKNFNQGGYHDVVYVTANPQVNLRLDNPFYKLINVWEDKWDDSVHTVPPAAMAEATLEAHQEFPNKRIISHFIQPHYPFIGELGQELEPHAGGELSYRQAKGMPLHREAPTVWEQLKEGTISKQEAWEAYIENLEITLPHVENLTEGFEGKTVVTSDHGNLFGEFAKPFPFRRYGHPSGLYTSNLIEVPWLTIESTDRKTIRKESPSLDSKQVSDEVENRLHDLGYRD